MRGDKVYWCIDTVSLETNWLLLNFTSALEIRFWQMLLRVPLKPCSASVSPDRWLQTGGVYNSEYKEGDWFLAFVCFYRLQPLNSWFLCWSQYSRKLSDKNKGLRYHDEAGVVSVPPTEGRDAHLEHSSRVEHLAGAVCVATQDQARLEPPQQLAAKKRQGVNAQTGTDTPMASPGSLTGPLIPFK